MNWPLRLDPTLAVSRSDNQTVNETLKKLGIRCITVDHQTIDGILLSIDKIGTLLDAERESRLLLDSIRKRIKTVEQHAGRRKPTVLVSVQRSFGLGKINKIFAAGQDGFYDEMIRIAGGVNVCRSSRVKYPELSAESIAALNPDIIIDLFPEVANSDDSIDKASADWQCIHGIGAVKNGRVYVFSKDYFLIPGPRFIDILEEFSKIIAQEKKN